MIVIYSSSLSSTTGSVFEQVFEAISNHNQSFGTAALGRVTTGESGNCVWWEWLV
jgi:hypothetical protein